MRTLAVASAFALASIVACDGGSTGDFPTGDATNGEALYGVHCEVCHGADAKSGSAGENLVEAATEEEAEWFDVVSNGKDNGAMPAFADELTEQEMADILAYVAGL